MKQPIKKRERGRPPRHGLAMLNRINIRLPAPVLEALERVRDGRQDGSDTSQVAREAIVLGLKELGEL